MKTEVPCVGASVRVTFQGGQEAMAEIVAEWDHTWFHVVFLDPTTGKKSRIEQVRAEHFSNWIESSLTLNLYSDRGERIYCSNRATKIS